MFKKKTNDLLGGLCNYNKSLRFDYNKIKIDLNSIEVGNEEFLKESR